MFEFVNEVAVIGTAFFMMAIATLWYSEYLFQKSWLAAVKLTEEDLIAGSQHVKLNMFVTFCSYILAIYIIAVVIGYAQVYGLPIQKITALAVLGFAALFAGFSVWEQRPISYLVVSLGFSTVFIVGSSFFLHNWPW